MLTQCDLCPKSCVIENGKSGDCRVRININGKLTASTYGYPCSVHVDPVEKKPLFHFYPGSSTFSLATAGCNLHCKNCQNWEISQANPEDVTAHWLPPARVAELTAENKCKSAAYTYTDPVVFYEYTLDSSVKVRERGLKNIIVTAGYINRKPLLELCKHTDAAHFDLKAYSDKFYRDVCDGELKPVLDAITAAKEAGVWVEIINLVIPGMNDSDNDLKNLCKWIKENTGAGTPLHLSRFFPHYRMRNIPPTPQETLERARKIAAAEGLNFVYVGNITIGDAENTRCPGCGKTIVKRLRYMILENLIKNGKCPFCGKEIPGVWS
jgi:pyruvate formate lyase activating enzyme